MNNIISRIKNDHYKYLEQKERGMTKRSQVANAAVSAAVKTSSAWLPQLIKTLGWIVGPPIATLGTAFGFKQMFSDTEKTVPPPAQQNQGIDSQSILGLAGLAGGIYLLNKYMDKKEKKNKISDDSLNRVEALMAQKKRKKRKENEILKMYDSEIV